MYNRIIACVTGAPSSIEVVKVALAISTPSTKLTLLHVVKKLDETVRKKAIKDLSRAKKESDGMSGCSHKFIVSSDVKKAIVSYAKEESADAIIIGFSSSMLGNISKFVLSKSPCTVILVRQK